MSEDERRASDVSSDSDDDAPVNIVGNIPMEWYDEFDHIGWTASGEKVIPKERPDKIEEIIRRSTDPNWWRRMYDRHAGEFRTLTDEDLDMLERIRSGRAALKDFQLHQPFRESEYPDKIHPICNGMISKGAFRPSRQTIYRVMKCQAALHRSEQEEQETEEEGIDIWSSEYDVKEQKRRGRRPPKDRRPGNDESYHPDAGSGRLFDVPSYDHFIRERFDRCSNLYLCPREMRVRLPDTAAEMLPELPDLEELRPYPTAESVRFVGHTGRVRCVDVNATGSLLISGGSEGVLNVWELQTGRLLRSFNLAELVKREEEAVVSVAFCKAGNRQLIAACCGRSVFIIRLREEDGDLPPVGEGITHLTEHIAQITNIKIHRWRQCVFGPSGNFVAFLGQSRQVFIYNTHTWEYRTPITSAKSYIQCVQFHPTKPRFFVATQHHIIAFDLVERHKLFQLKPFVQWVSSIAIHPSGDHVLAGSFDGRGLWFDTELQVEPFKILRSHEGAVRDVAYSQRFPLFATASDDAKIYVFHGTVFDDLVTDPRIVPVKELCGHDKNNVLGVLAVVWHPTQPWLISAGADHSIRLWC